MLAAPCRTPSCAPRAAACCPRRSARRRGVSRPLCAQPARSTPRPQPPLPAAARLLLEGAPPSSVADARALLQSLSLPRHSKAAALASLGAPVDSVLLRAPGAVPDARRCAALVAELVARADRREADTVDGQPALQLALTRRDLEARLGPDAVARLWALPRLLAARMPGAATRWPHARAFARLYTPSLRPSLGFHTDECEWTVNVALTGPGECEGGELLLLAGEKVVGAAAAAAPGGRGVGDATVHRASVAHAVAAVTAGRRASLIVFFGVPLACAGGV